MDADEEVLSGRRARRRWLVVLGALPLLGLIGAGGWLVRGKLRRERRAQMVERVTGAAFGCVAAIRGDAPETWGLERALEHMSRMERVTRDPEDPTTAAERARFARLAREAARGCRELGDLMREAHREDALYFGVPARLAQRVESDDPERWFRRVLPDTRPEAEELTRQVRAMARAINERRDEYDLMAQELLVEGRDLSPLARIIEVALPPRDREHPRTEVWPTPRAIFVLTRGRIPLVPCETRFASPRSCDADYLQLVTWDGQAGEQRPLERPARVRYWSAFTPTFEGSLWAVGIDTQGRGIVGRYRPGASTPELLPLQAPLGADARMETVRGGVVVLTPDGSAWRVDLEGPPAARRVASPPPPLILRAGPGGAAQGVELEGQGTLSVFGSEEDGFTSRLALLEEGDVLLRMIDAHRRVREVVDLRALRSGRAVALLQRFREAPDAIAITSTFGRSWLSGGTPETAPR